MSELSEDIEVFWSGKYSRHYFCPGCSRYYLVEDCEQKRGPAICPECKRRVRTRPLNKNRSKFEHKYTEAR